MVIKDCMNVNKIMLLFIKTHLFLYGCQQHVRSGFSEADSPFKACAPKTWNYLSSYKCILFIFPYLASVFLGET